MRNTVKSLVLFLCILLVSPLWLGYLLSRSFMGNAAFYGYSQLMALFPGLCGNYLRLAFYRLTLARCGKDACICFMATLSHPDIEIGAGAYVGPFCNLGLCSIGDDCLLGTGVHVMSGFGQHGTDDLSRPIREQGGTLVRVRIGSNSWIGNQAVIGADVGAQCIIGAASVVTKPIPEFSVALGSPAKPIRDRRDKAPTA
jgi:virginiamycin A acetyltransferase